MITLERKYKINLFVEKNEVQISCFAVAKKAPSLEKYIFRKKILPAYLCRYDLQNGAQKFF